MASLRSLSLRGAERGDGDARAGRQSNSPPTPVTARQGHWDRLGTLVILCVCAIRLTHANELHIPHYLNLSYHANKEKKKNVWCGFCVDGDKYANMCNLG